MCKINLFDKISAVLVIFGALAWGVIGIAGVNLIAIISGGLAVITRMLYILILISAVDLITLLFRCNIISSIKNNNN